MSLLDMAAQAGIWVLEILAIAVSIALSVAYITYAERRVIGWMQVPKGCNRVGPAGLLQPLADGLKLVLKETIIPTNANKFLFVAAPVMALIPSFIAFAVVPFGETTFFGIWETTHIMSIANLNIGLLYVMAISGLGIYGVLMAGWASNSKFPFIGAMRATCQMISYEISMGFGLVTVMMLAGSLNLADIVHAQSGGILHWYMIPLFPMLLVFFISGCAETGRTPFDLVETEELVSGYHTEYSGMWFATFSLAEYGAIILISLMTSILFLGGWYAPIPALDFIPGTVWLLGKTAFIVFVFIWFRATFPRYRYDQMMRLGWKVFLPWTLGWIFVVGLFIYTPGLDNIINFWIPWR
jgi:NADH-quinone oxidoreductase subunit H